MNPSAPPACARWRELSDRSDLEEELDERERSYLVSHPAACARCAREVAFYSHLARLGQEVVRERPDELTVKGLVRTNQARLRARRAGPALALMAAAAALAALWLVPASPPTPSAPRVPAALSAPGGGAPLAALGVGRVTLWTGEGTVGGSPVSAGAQLNAGAVVATERGPLCVRLPTGIDACLMTAGALRVLATGGDAIRVDLERGTLLARLTHHPRRSFTVRTGAGDSTAIGTTFLVAAEPHGMTRTEVLEGAVRAAPHEGNPLVVRAGHAATMRPGATAPVPTAPVLPAPEPSVLESMALWQTGQDAWLEVWTEPAGALVKVDGRAIGRAPVALALPFGGHRVEAQRPGSVPVTEELTLAPDERALRTYALDTEPALDAPDPSTTEPHRAPRVSPKGATKGAPPFERPSPDELLARARALQAGSRAGDAMAAYRGLLRAHPSSPEAQLGRISLGELLLTREVGFEEALAMFDAYLRHGGKTLELEARFGRIRALKALGRTEEAAAETERFLRDFPTSMQARSLAGREGDR